MANLSQEPSHYDMALVHTFPFLGQPLQCADYALGYLSLENQNLLPEFVECSEKTASNLSIFDHYSANDARVVVAEMNSPTKESFSLEENDNCIVKPCGANSDFSQCLYPNEDQDMFQDENLESMAFCQSSNNLAAAIREGACSRVTVDSCLMETTSCCYRLMCSQPEEGCLGVEQFQLFSEVEDGAYSMESFGVQQSPNSYNKRPYVGGDVIESPSAKKQCASTSPRKPKPKPSPSKDPQSVAAKNRRERISERLKILQDLVPNGTKVDLVTMLEKAISYVKFLQLQVKVLATDEFWQSQGGKAQDIGQVKEAIDAILFSHKATTRTKEGED